MKRNPFSFGRLLVAAIIFSASFAAAHAQQSHCSNAQVNAAYVTMLRAASGSGSSGECDPGRYGPWTSQQDLNNRVAHSMDCPDPWIGVIYATTYSRRPTSAECNIQLYNHGSWNGYSDLANKIGQYHNGTPVIQPVVLKAPAGDYLVIPSGALVDSLGTVVATPGSYILANDGATLVGNAGGTILPQPGMVISNDGGSLSTQRSIMSNGKRVIKGKILRR